MNTANFFHSYFGMYMIQSFFHALVATIIIGAAIEAWKIESPIVRQRFRLSIILLSIFSFPVYQLIDAERGSLVFRVQALFDSARWLEMELWNLIPLHVFLLALFAFTTFIFIFQEMLPILRHFIVPTVEPQIAVIKPGPDSPVGRALKPLSAFLPDVFIIHEDDPVIFSTTAKKQAIYLSAGLAANLTPEQLRAAVAHEIAHVGRSRRPVLLAGFFLRTLMFFNPVVLVEFRRAIRNEEKICDDIAVSLTGDPAALAETLKRFYSSPEDEDAGQECGKRSFWGGLEDYSHMLQLETRIARLEQASIGTGSSGNAWFPFFLSIIVVITLNYYIV